jgi:3-hydroxybutyryl-CoA dehydrogenase
MDVQAILVIGAVLMGGGIAQVAAQNGYEVVLNDVSHDLVEKGYHRIADLLEGQVKKNRMTAADRRRFCLVFGRRPVSMSPERWTSSSRPLSRISKSRKGFSRDWTTSAQRKLSCLQHLFHSHQHPAATTKRPDRFIGMHFFSPVPLMRLVEIIRGLKTSEETARTAEAVAVRMQKEPVR